MADELKKRPILNTQVTSEFGELSEEDLLAPNGSGRDGLYTPGFSEMRQARDLAISEVKSGERQGHHVPILPVNVRLVRSSSPINGRPDGRKVLGSENLGYRPVTKADIGQPWFLKMPPGTHELPDGTLQKGDCTYMVADAKTAARNQAAKRQRTAASQTDDASANGLIEVVSKHKGASPSARKLTGDKITKAEVFAD